jgi:hypothetical protein
MRGCSDTLASLQPSAYPNRTNMYMQTARRSYLKLPVRQHLAAFLAKECTNFLGRSCCLCSVMDYRKNAPVPAFAQTLSCLGFNALHIAALLPLSVPNGTEGILTGICEDLCFDRTRYTLAYPKWGQNDTKSDLVFDPAHPHKPYVYQMMPETWPASVLLHSLAAALNHTPAELQTLNPQANYTAPITLRQQFDAFAALYPAYSSKYQKDTKKNKDHWADFCVGLMEVWDLVWVLLPSEAGNYDGEISVLPDDKLSALRTSMEPRSTAMLTRVRFQRAVFSL